MLTTSSIPNLINGVSQQPPTLRLASQAESQLNFLSSVSDGLTVRPPTRHLAELAQEDWADAFIHTINRDANERYVVVIRQGQIRVFEADTGVERTVNAPRGLSYLSQSVGSDFRAVSVADYTFIVNRNRTVLSSSVLSAERPNQAIVSVRAGNYGRDYQIYIDDDLAASHATPDGSVPDHVDDIDTTLIAANLTTALQAWVANNGGASVWTILRAGDRILITRNDATAFSVRSEDGAGGVNMQAIQGQVQRFSDLPKEGFDGFQVEVVGDQSSNFDNYHLEYDANSSGGLGVWKETRKGGEEFLIRDDTMPHTLVREADGTFTFSRPDWESRKVGDIEKIPFPSFVERTIRDIFFFQNRLGFVSDENVIMSRDGEYFKFFRGTATTTLDTDPIDVALTSERVSILNFAVPFNKTLLLFSDQSQFVLEGGGFLTPDTVSVAQATSFESLSTVRPVGVGQFVYFPVPRGSNSGVREYFVQQGNEQNDALDVTSHVPRYLPKGLTEMSASSSEDTLICLSNQQPNAMWVYRFFFNNEGKLQSAWSKWEFGSQDNILSTAFIESRLYMVVSRNGSTFIDVMSLESGNTDADSTVSFRLDRGVTEQECVRTFDGEHTTITLPYETSDEIVVVVRGGDASFSEGTIVGHEQLALNQVRVRGDWTNSSLVIGTKFVARYLFSTFYIRSPEQGGGVSSEGSGRLQLRYLSIDYSRTGFFRVRSTPRGRNTSEKIFSGRTLGIESGSIGQLNLATGRVRVPLMCRNVDANIEIVCDSPLPASFTAADWEATYTTRARKV